MSYSETITRTDLANILNEVLPVAGATDPSTWQYTPLTSSNPSMYTNPAGGYYKLGRLVVVQCRFYVTGTFPASDYNTVTGELPVPSLIQASLGVTWNYADSSTHASAVVSSTGSLVVQSGSKALTASTLFITGAYIAQ